MRFTFVTNYNQNALTVMARALRKTVRKKKNKRSRILGWVAALLGILLLFASGEGTFSLDFRTAVTALAVAAIVAVLIFEDQMNGYFAGKRMLPGTEKAEAVFCEEGYTSVTEAGKTEWKYEKIVALAESEEYFAFVFGTNHAQVYEKSGLSGGSAEEFRGFIERKTGKTVVRM